MIAVVLPFQVSASFLISPLFALAIRSMSGFKSVSNSCSVMPQSALKSSCMLMFFRLFSSLKMLSWLNLLMPVMKRKRRYCPNLLRGAEELPHLVAELLLQGGVGIAVQQGGIVLVNQHDNLLADLLGSSQNDALQTLGSGLFRFILSINLFPPVQEEIKLPRKVGQFHVFC